MLKEFVKERLMAAADEIFGLFERTIASYEEELSRTKEEKERYRQQLEAVGKNEIVLPIDDVQQLIGHQEERQGGSSALKQEDSQPPDLKEEKGELCITQESLPGLEEDALTKLPPVGVSVKTEDHEDKPPESSQLHHSSGEENRGPEPSSSSSPQRTTAEAGGDYCGGSQADNLLAPLSDCEAEDGDDTKEFLSSTTDCEVDMRAHTDGKGNKERQLTSMEGEKEGQAVQGWTVRPQRGIPAIMLTEPLPKVKSRKEYAKNHREKRKKNPELYEVFKACEKFRIQEYRSERQSDAAKQRAQELQRERQRRYRQREKEGQSAQPRTRKTCEKLRKRTRKTCEKLRKQWREQKKKQRERMSQEKVNSINQKRRAAYQSKRMKKKGVVGEPSILKQSPPNTRQE
ncbi:trichohyalin-like isoform X2 [Dunckerocampus dactyliophorus]|uniref:trichohyalin-like isoform X2 n=1 Tax=Dunckerocampus dactyliophorus TaxID=161453 RepID=UPI00240746A6|nr:trichohyalin-like isoform X2 [Dunckerocampus dactyliophorus]